MTHCTDELTLVKPEMLSMPVVGAWGFLVTNNLHRSSPFAGMSRFVWFQNRDSLELALQTSVIAFDDQGPRTIALKEYGPDLPELVKSWKDETPDLEAKRSGLNARLRNDSKLAWIGSFEALCQEDGPIEQDVRLWYRKEEGLAGDCEPIDLRDRGSFGYALQAYGL